MDFSNPIKELRNIIAVIDCQGFISNKKFIPREMAIITDNYAAKFDIKTNLNPDLMTSKDLTTNFFNQKFIHGLEYNPTSSNIIKIEDFEIYLKDLYGLMKKNNESTFAVKNSQLKKILEENNIPVTDLDNEQFNIPAIENIEVAIPERFTNCESHGRLATNCQRKNYCALMKVKALKNIVDSRLRALIGIILADSYAN